ncbi:MAG: RNB domain-containing ribonuclease, partial [Acidimicrobiales bacterium]
PPLRLDDDAPELRAGLDRIRAEFDVPGPHSAAAVSEATEAARRVLGGLGAASDAGRRDARDIELVTIDPPGSRDLDQALHIQRRQQGWRVRYAIADVPAFVVERGALAREVEDRGVTFYLPDHRSPLYPPSLSEDAASLLPGQDRAAVLWTIDLASDGAVSSSHLERAIVRSRAQLTYAEVQVDIDSGRSSETLPLLAEVGRVRQEAEAARDGVSLDLPSQLVVGEGGRYRLAWELSVPAMGWNAQISLLTGMVAAEAMLRAGVGLLRTLPPPDHQVIETVRRTATALGVTWPAGATYASVVRHLDGADSDQAAILALAARGLRGAGYLALGTGSPPPEDPALLRHAAVAAPYAHVTAPLRRLCDRASIEVCLALYAGQTVSAEVVAELAGLPKAMARTRAREGGAARAVVDLVEALTLAPRVGAVLDATVVASGPKRSTIVVHDLAVQADIDGATLPLGDTVSVRIEAADPVARRVRFAAV